MQSGAKKASDVLEIIKRQIVVIGGFDFMYSCGKIRVECRDGYAYLTEAEFLNHFDGGKTIIPYRTKF